MIKPALPDQSRILEAEQRIRPQLGETPLLNVPDLDAAMGQSLGLKCESLQRTGSFKARGALNWLLTASADELKAGQVVDRIVTVSEAGIREATRRLLTEARLYVEPGASVGLAALLENQVPPEPEKTTVLIITGGNLDPEQVNHCL